MDDFEVNIAGALILLESHHLPFSSFIREWPRSLTLELATSEPLGLTEPLESNVFVLNM